MNSDNQFSAILIDHARRYPAWQLDDLYKLAHQAAMGSEHAITDEKHARDWLAQEIGGLGAGPAEPLIDPVSGDGQIVRVHLRPYLTGGFEPNELLTAFLRTAREFHGSADTLRSYWQVAKHLAEDGKIPFTGPAVNALFHDLLELGFPAMHHSATFEQKYRPAYRVVVKDFLPGKVAMLSVTRTLNGCE